MSTLRFSWKGVIAVVLCSIVVSTADRLLAQVGMSPYDQVPPIICPNGETFPMHINGSPINYPTSPCGGGGSVERIALQLPASSPVGVQPFTGNNVAAQPVFVPEQHSAAGGYGQEKVTAMPPVQTGNDAGVPIADSASMGIIQELVTQLSDIRRENGDLQIQNARLEQELKELQSRIQQLQETIAALSPVPQPQQGVAEPAPSIFGKVLNWFRF